MEEDKSIEEEQAEKEDTKMLMEDVPEPENEDEQWFVKKHL